MYFKCARCGEPLDSVSSACGACGATSVGMQVEGNPPSKPNPDESFLSNLVNGNYGLAKTYWLYGVLTSWLISLVGLAAVILTKSQGLGVVLLIVFFLYFVFIAAAIWNAANKYAGNRIWSALAKVSLVLSFVANVVQVFR